MKILTKLGFTILFLITLCLDCELTYAKKLPLESVITFDAEGKLKYVQDEKGNILPDFSYAGYKKSEQPLPHIERKLTITPVSGDNTAHIQAGIDALIQLPLQEDGFRGALVLERGVYSVSGQLKIKESGIVLRGVGREEKNTVIIAAGTDKRSLFRIEGNLSLTKNKKATQKLVGTYIPVGTQLVKVENASEFSVGQQVIIERPGTKQWIEDIGMDKLLPRKDDRAIKQWAPKKYNLRYERKITKIEQNTLYLDMPLVQMMQDKYGGGVIYPIETSGRLENIGIENMLLISEYKKGKINPDEDHSWAAIEIADTENAWVTNITSKHFARSLVSVERGARFITVSDSSSLDPASINKGGRRYSFNLEGTQALFLRCFARNGRHDFITSSKVAGPSAFVYGEAIKTHSDIGPHHRWATGILYDNVKGGQINIQDRGNYGSGHGWSGAQNVLWNTQATKKSAVQSPPEAINWSIGHIGKRWRGRFKRTEAIWISPGQHVEPQSLFFKQLTDRIGKQQAEKVLAKRQFSLQ